MNKYTYLQSLTPSYKWLPTWLKIVKEPDKLHLCWNHTYDDVHSLATVHSDNSFDLHIHWAFLHGLESAEKAAICMFSSISLLFYKKYSNYFVNGNYIPFESVYNTKEKSILHFNANGTCLNGITLPINKEKRRLFNKHMLAWEKNLVAIATMRFGDMIAHKDITSIDYPKHAFNACDIFNMNACNIDTINFLPAPKYTTEVKSFIHNYRKKHQDDIYIKWLLNDPDTQYINTWLQENGYIK